MPSQHLFGFSVPTKPWTQGRGSREALYYETPEIDILKNTWSGVIKSISAMDNYKDRSHEELRLQDYELLKAKGFSFPSQSAFQQSSPRFGHLTSAPGSSSIFGIQNSSGFEGTTSTKYQRSRPGFSATAEIANTNNTHPFWIPWNLQSISAMPFYEDKSHEELRSEDYGLCDTCYKGGQTHWGAPFSRLSCLKTSDTPSNIFSFAPLSNQSSVPSTFQPFKSTLSELKRDNIITPSNTISTAPTLSPPVNPLCCTNMYPSQPQAFTPATAPFMPSFTPNLNPPSLLPFTEPMVKSSCQCPNISTTFTSVSAPLSNQFTVHSPFQPLRSCFSEHKTENHMTPSSKISTAPTLSSSGNPFSSTDMYLSPQAQATLQPATASSGPTFTLNLNPPSLIPFTDLMLKKSCECPKVSNTFTISSVVTCSITEPSVIASSSIKFTPVTLSDLWSSIVNVSQPQQTSEKVEPLSTNDLNTPSQASSGLTAVTQFISQNISGLQYNASSNSSMQSSLVVNPFATRFPTNQPNVQTSRLHGISSPSVSNNLSRNRRASLLRLRRVSSRYPELPTQKPNGKSSETKVPFFIDEEDKADPLAPFLARENPSALVNISSLSLHSPRESKGDEIKDSSSSFQVIERLSEDMSALLNEHEDEVDATTERHEADVVALLPKLPDGEEYYTEPSLVELAAKEKAEAGFCRHVKDFVVGRQGYGSIKFLGETDIRHLDIESVVQLKNGQVIVYPEGRKKPGVGQQLNKAAELTLLNVKCINKKTGKQYVEGHQVENYKEILTKKAQELGGEFVSYDPVKGEWKFRVQHF